MLLSFSVPSMLPMIEAGLAELRGEPIAGARVKRQTIRQLGTRGKKLINMDPLSHTITYDLHLWWKSRRSERIELGTVPCTNVRVYRVEILHSTVQPVNEAERACIRVIIMGDHWRDDCHDEDDEPSDTWIFWSPGDDEPNDLLTFARADGFDSVEDFVSFFVPKRGDRFHGILYKW